MIHGCLGNVSNKDLVIIKNNQFTNAIKLLFQLATIIMFPFSWNIFKQQSLSTSNFTKLSGDDISAPSVIVCFPASPPLSCAIIMILGRSWWVAWIHIIWCAWVLEISQQHNSRICQEFKDPLQMCIQNLIICMSYKNSWAIPCQWSSTHYSENRDCPWPVSRIWRTQDKQDEPNQTIIYITKQEQNCIIKWHLHFVW